MRPRQFQFSNNGHSPNPSSIPIIDTNRLYGRNISPAISIYRTFLEQPSLEHFPQERLLPQKYDLYNPSSCWVLDPVALTYSYVPQQKQELSTTKFFKTPESFRVPHLIQLPQTSEYVQVLTSPNFNQDDSQETIKQKGTQKQYIFDDIKIEPASEIEEVNNLSKILPTQSDVKVKQKQEDFPLPKRMITQPKEDLIDTIRPNVNTQVAGRKYEIFQYIKRYPNQQHFDPKVLQDPQILNTIPKQNHEIQTQTDKVVTEQFVPDSKSRFQETGPNLKQTVHNRNAESQTEIFPKQVQQFSPKKKIFQHWIGDESKHKQDDFMQTNPQLDRMNAIDEGCQTYSPKTQDKGLDPIEPVQQKFEQPSQIRQVEPFYQQPAFEKHFKKPIFKGARAEPIKSQVILSQQNQEIEENLIQEQSQQLGIPEQPDQLLQSRPLTHSTQNIYPKENQTIKYVYCRICEQFVQFDKSDQHSKCCLLDSDFSKYQSRNNDTTETKLAKLTYLFEYHLLQFRTTSKQSEIFKQNCEEALISIQKFNEQFKTMSQKEIVLTISQFNTLLTRLETPPVNGSQILFIFQKIHQELYKLSN